MTLQAPAAAIAHKDAHHPILSIGLWAVPSLDTVVMVAPATESVRFTFPWVRFLPTEDVRAFVIELVDTLRAADALGNVAPVVQVITEWRHTAEVHADPELAARIRQGDDDYGAVPEPATHT